MLRAVAVVGQVEWRRMLAIGHSPRIGARPKAPDLRTSAKIGNSGWPPGLWPANAWRGAEVRREWRHLSAPARLTLGVNCVWLLATRLRLGAGEASNNAGRGRPDRLIVANRSGP